MDFLFLFPYFTWLLAYELKWMVQYTVLYLKQTLIVTEIDMMKAWIFCCAQM